MSFNINEFSANLRFGGARSNLFKVDMAFPNGVGDGRDLEFRCKAASIPGSTIESVEVPYMGRSIKLAGNRTYETWTATIINDEDFALHDLFMSWHDGINSSEGNINTFGTANPAAYKRDAGVTHYGKGGNAIKRYNWIGLFPTNVGSIELSWEDNNTIEEFTVDFAYDYFSEGSGFGFDF